MENGITRMGRKALTKKEADEENRNLKEECMDMEWILDE